MSKHLRFPGQGVAVVPGGQGAVVPVHIAPVKSPSAQVEVAEQTYVLGLYTHAPTPSQPVVHGPTPQSLFGSVPAVAPTHVVPFVTWQTGHDAT